MTILGYIVSNNQNMSEINFENVVGRIRSQIQLWSKFRLSLPGRITIAKTFLLSQIGYFSSIIQFNTNMISILRLEIGIYIKSNLKISIDKVFQNISYGGLGMINVKNYIEGLQVGLYKKTFSSTNFWAKEIKQYRVNPDFAFHFSNNVNTNTPCGDIVFSVKLLSTFFTR